MRQAVYGFGKANPEKSNTLNPVVPVSVWTAYKAGIPQTFLKEMFPDHANTINRLFLNRQMKVFKFDVRNPRNGEIFEVGSRKTPPDWFKDLCVRTKNPRRYMVK